MTRRFFLLLPWCGAEPAAQPLLAPCIASAREAGRLRLLFRAPRGLRRRPARVVLLLHLRGPAPETVRINGRTARVASEARGWAAVALPRAGAWERITLEPGEPFDGCADPATSPSLVFDPAPPAQ